MRDPTANVRETSPALWLGLLLVVPVALTANADADLWWHLLAGDHLLDARALPAVDDWSYTAAGRPWINHEWLPDLAIATAYRGMGQVGLLALRAGCLTLLLGAWLASIARWLPNATVAWLLVGLPWPMLALLGNLRPQTATWMFVAVMVYAIGRAADGARYAPLAIIGLVWLWANTHGGFLFGWGLGGLGLLTVAANVDGGPHPTRHRLACLLGALGVAVAPTLNPYGTDLWWYVLTEITADHPDLPEWQPPVPALAAILACTAAAPALVWAITRERMRIAPWVGLVVALVSAMQHAKMIALVFLLAIPCFAEAAAPLWRKLRALPDGPELVRALDGRLVRWAALVVLALFAGALHGGPIGQVPIGDRYPEGAVHWLAAAQAPNHGRLLVPLGWGGVALYHLHPRWTVSMDGRNTTVYAVNHVSDDTRAWREGDLDTLLEGAPTAALVPINSKVADALSANGAWRAVYEDDVAAVYLERNTELRPGEPTARDDRFP